MNSVTHTRTTPASREEADGGATAAARKRADDKAVASFILGLVGLAVFNAVLGPLALVLSVIALAKGTSRPGRALLGAALGVADLVILAVIVSSQHGVTWHPGF